VAGNRAQLRIADFHPGEFAKNFEIRNPKDRRRKTAASIQTSAFGLLSGFGPSGFGFRARLAPSIGSPPAVSNLIRVTGLKRSVSRPILGQYDQWDNVQRAGVSGLGELPDRVHSFSPALFRRHSGRKSCRILTPESKT
jgi:hypothetical protein